VLAVGVIATWSATPAPAFAHTGRSLDGAADGLLHPLTGIDHLLVMVAVGVIAASSRDRRVTWATPLAFLGGMLAGGLIDVIGSPLGLSELVIGASVVVAGGLVVTSNESTGVWMTVLALAFGVAHGHAHAAELPEGAAPAAYAIGFLAATVALHLSGTALGLGFRRLPALRVAAGTAIGTTGLALLAL
jgi:urease accessory protein